jgi:hypothetical protein
LNFLEPAFRFALAERNSDRGAVTANASHPTPERAPIKSIEANFAGNCSIFG